MAERTSGRKQQAHQATVVGTRQLAPHMVRVELTVDPQTGFAPGEFTDHYVKLLFPALGIRYPEPFDMGRIREELPRDQWPVTRTYTVRSWEADSGRLSIDFVVHGDEGLAGPWAAKAQPGDRLRFLGPGGGYAPRTDAAWHLLAGDESALPAIAAALEHMPSGVPVRALIEVAGASEEQELRTPPGAEVGWLHRGSGRVGERLVPAVRELAFPDGPVQAFVHGEAGMVKELRRHLRLERGVSREQLSISGYWRLGRDEDGWQASKREWNAQVEAEQEGERASAGR